MYPRPLGYLLGGAAGLPLYPRSHNIPSGYPAVSATDPACSSPTKPSPSALVGTETLLFQIQEDVTVSPHTPL